MIPGISLMGWWLMVLPKAGMWVVVSSGSACSSACLEPFYVLRALGVDEDMVHTSIMFGIRRFTTKDGIDKVVELTVNQV
ncbi:putative sulfurtransferase [Helianthus debilis subsp. tardiflorus]